MKSSRMRRLKPLYLYPRVIKYYLLTGDTRNDASLSRAISLAALICWQSPQLRHAGHHIDNRNDMMPYGAR